MSGRLPNFLLIGAPKSGTTSLYHYLRQHPQIFMSAVKEPRFFAHDGQPPGLVRPGGPMGASAAVTELSAYQELFAPVRNEIAVGEASPSYLSNSRCATAIAARIPHARLIAILRNPADRAYSAYSHGIREGWETKTFEDSLEAEPDRLEQGWGRYRGGGYYARQLKRYLEKFDWSQIRVVLYEDLAQPEALYASICRFLAVDDSFRADFTIRHNSSGRPRRLDLQQLMMRPHKVKEFLKRFVPEGWGHAAIAWVSSKNLQREPMNPETRRRLLDGYREDIKELEGLIDRNLSHWLT